MRIACPLCGARDSREFTYKGAAVALSRPSPDADGAKWDDSVHNRDNPAGPTRDLWYHDPCGSWLVVERDMVTHEVMSAILAEEATR